MKIISKRKGSDSQPTFTLTKEPEPNTRNSFILHQFNENISVELKQTRKGFEAEIYVCNKFLKFFISNADVEIIE